MITFRCAKCSVLVQTPRRKAGKPVTCNKCKHVTICPPTSILVPLPPLVPKKRHIGSAGFFVTIVAIGLACLILLIWTVALLS